MNGVEQNQTPGAAPTLRWLLIGAIYAVLIAFALDDLIAWVASWRQP